MKDTKKQSIKSLEERVKKLRVALAIVNKAPAANGPFTVKIQKTQKRFKRVRVQNGPDVGIGEFLLLLDVTAIKDILYIPLSLASGKKPTGFVYQIEGTAKGSIGTTTISCKGDGVTQITVGTILYVKIPVGTKATFRMFIEIKGKVNNAYKITINRVHYKHNINDARYKKSEKEVSTETLKFR